MQIDEIHSWINFITNKKLGTYFTPPENDAALHRGQLDEFMHLKGEYADSIEIQNSLQPFKAKFTFTAPTSAGGTIAIPTDLEYLLAVQVNVSIGISQIKYKGVKILSEDELADRLNSQLRPVTALDPVGILDPGNNLQLFPEQTYAGYIRYLKTPIAPVFGFTQVGRVITYDPLLSTQMLWDNTSLKNIMLRALQYLGVSVDDSEMVQYTEQKINAPD